MLPEINRRRFLEVAAATATAVGVGAAAPAATPALNRIEAGVLDAAFIEAGQTNGEPVILLHGWPYDIHAFD